MVQMMPSAASKDYGPHKTLCKRWGETGVLGRMMADWLRDALQAMGIEHCIPGRKSRLKPVNYDKRRYKRRYRIEILFGRLKDWRRVATRYDLCPTVFFSAIALAGHRHLLAAINES